jgi:hypothetical protein
MQSNRQALCNSFTAFITDFRCTPRGAHDFDHAPRGPCVHNFGRTTHITGTSLFVFRCGIDTVYLLLYVDDIVLTTSSTSLLQHTISALKREFIMKYLGPLHHF